MSLSAEQQKLATIFPEIIWSVAGRVCIFRPVGSLTSHTIARLVAWLAELERDSGQPFFRFTDLTHVQTHEITKLDVANLAYWRRTTYTGPVVKSAFLAHSEEGLELVHLYRSRMAGSPIVVAVFESLPAAASWLGVSPETLDPGKVD